MHARYLGTNDVGENHYMKNPCTEHISSLSLCQSGSYFISMVPLINPGRLRQLRISWMSILWSTEKLFIFMKSVLNIKWMFSAWYYSESSRFFEAAMPWYHENHFILLSLLWKVTISLLCKYFYSFDHWELPYHTHELSCTHCQ